MPAGSSRGSCARTASRVMSPSTRLGHRWLWLASAVLLIGGAVAAWAALTRHDSAPGGAEITLENIDVYGTVPDFSLVERSGRRIGRVDLLGKVWVADFIYTECTETCPTQSLQLARLQREFTAPDLRFVSITVDPRHDTREVLQRYAARYGADPQRWFFLTGEKRAIYCLAKDGFHLSVVDQADPNPPPCRVTSGAEALQRWVLDFLEPPAFASHGSQGLLMHSARLVLVDRQARVRAYHLATDEASLKHLRPNLRTLLNERRQE